MKRKEERGRKKKKEGRKMKRRKLSWAQNSYPIVVVANIFRF